MKSHYLLQFQHRVSVANVERSSRGLNTALLVAQGSDQSLFIQGNTCTALIDMVQGTRDLANDWVVGRYGRGDKARMYQRGVVTIYFSWNTPIGYFVPEEGTVARKNVWGPTTGGHLNQFSNPSDRISGTEFEQRYKAMLERHGIDPSDLGDRPIYSPASR